MIPGRPLLARPTKDDLRATLMKTAFLSAWAFGIITAVGDTRLFWAEGLVSFDSHAYWLAGRSEHPYGAPPGSKDAFLYSPAFAQLMRPLALLPWSVFAALWMIAVTATFLWLTAPLPWRWRIPVLLACVPEVLLGNVYAFLGLAAVLGMRRPEFWAFPLLTKISPGLLGLLWFGVRGEWRQVARVMTASLVITGGSYLLDPTMWHEWFQFLAVSRADDKSFLVARALVAAGAVVIAARWNKAWCLPLAMWLAAPVFSASSRDLAVLSAAVRLSNLGGMASAAQQPSTETPQDPGRLGRGAAAEDRDV
jgi:hypothetical protein